LTPEKVIIDNIPDIIDVNKLINLLQALGVKLLDENGHGIGFGGLYLKDFASIDTSTLQRFTNIEMTFLCDVSNKLLGPNGTARVYSQQKGASVEEVAILADNLEHFAGTIQRATGINITEFTGSGAAGGLAAGLSLLFKSNFTSGSEFVISASKLKAKIQNTDFIITGEGELNSQTKFGKLPYKIAEIAGEHNKPVIGFFGNITEDVREEFNSQFYKTASLCVQGISKEKAIQNAYSMLVKKVKEVFKDIQLN